MGWLESQGDGNEMIQHLKRRDVSSGERGPVVQLSFSTRYGVTPHAQEEVHPAGRTKCVQVMDKGSAGTEGRNASQSCIRRVKISSAQLPKSPSM